jgi:hypothetical protein
MIPTVADSKRTLKIEWKCAPNAVELRRIPDTIRLHPG